MNTKNDCPCQSAPWGGDCTHPQPAELAEQQGVDSQPINIPAAHALVQAIGPGFRVIYRDAFRWKDEKGDVLPNHYECQGAPQLADENGHELVADFGFAAILRDKRLPALAATGKQQVGEEVSVEEDVYYSIADMIEPYMQREGSNPDGPLPASVYDSVQIVFDNWLKTRAQVGEVQGDALAQFEAWAKSNNYSSLKWPDGAYAEDAMQLAWKAWQHLAARQPGAQSPVGCVECPVTGLPFYDNMEHPKRGVIAMYGGPFDVFSIPELQENDGELRRERYDLDADGWVEGGEPLGYFYSDQQPDAAPPAQGNDLGQLHRLIALATAVVHYKDESPMKNGVFAEAERVLALIGQRDAAPGVE
jgi:hypothetical protein